MKGVVIAAGVVLSLISFTSYKALTQNAQKQPINDVKSVILNPQSEGATNIEGSGETELVPTETPTPTPSPTITPTPTPVLIEVTPRGAGNSTFLCTQEIADKIKALYSKKSEYETKMKECYAKEPGNCQNYPEYKESFDIERQIQTHFAKDCGRK